MSRRTGRRRGHPFLRDGDPTVILRIKLPASTLHRIDVRARELRMGRSTWARLVMDNALAKVPRERTQSAVWLGEQLRAERPPLIADVNRAALDVLHRPGPPRCLP